MRNFSICVLLYGNYTNLARRCLESIKTGIRTDAIFDLRIGLNQVNIDTAEYVFDFAKDFGPTAHIYHSPDNTYKYPMMRRMVYDRTRSITCPYVMWFDDDSYLTCEDPNWIDAVERNIEPVDMIGQNQWRMPMVGNQWNWITGQKWFNPSVGKPPEKTDTHYFKFCQGAWWTAKLASLKALDWPWEELRHNGGDSMLGESQRHVGQVTAYFDTGVRINADQYGTHSASPRRGYSEKRIGANPAAASCAPFEHQDFYCTVKSYNYEAIGT